MSLSRTSKRGACFELWTNSSSDNWPTPASTSSSTRTAMNGEKVECEIAENRAVLERLVSHPLEHFCYPSGAYALPDGRLLFASELNQGEWLAALGVKSATTIEPGLNYPDTPRFALRRLMDGHPVSDIEFEAEMTGFLEIIRALRDRRFCRMLRRRLRSYSDHNGSSLQDRKDEQGMRASGRNS